MLPEYFERVGSIAKSNAGFSFEGGKASIEYHMAWDDVSDFCKTALGSVSVGEGKLIRNLPLAHPVFPWLFVTSVATIEGLKFIEKSDAVEELEAEPIPEYALYEHAKVVLEFAPRPYALYKDESISVEAIEYYDDEGGTVTKNIAAESWRFVEFSTKASMEYLTAQHGTYRMAGTGESTPPSFPGQVRLLKKTKNITLTWHQVPFVVSEGPNIYEGLGKINQLEFFGFPIGTLLFQSYTTTKPMPHPFPDMVIDEDTGSSIPSAEKIVNVEFSFLYLDPDLGGQGVTPQNKNHIAGGHNAFPWFKDGKYYYATTGGAANSSPVEGIPPYKSYPFQLLFTPS
jgi:hypothetical protein